MSLVKSLAGATVFAVSAFSAPAAFAQNAGGVFGPEVTPGSRALEWRIAVAPEDDAGPTGYATRIHYQQSVTDDLRLRAVVQGADNGPGGFDFAFTQFEAQWQFLEDEIHGWDSAVRLDIRAGEDAAEFIGLNWTSDVPLSEKWVARGIFMTGVEVGDRRRDGLFLQTRWSLRYKLNPNYSIQAQVFNIYGTTEDVPDFEQQNHAVGPALTGKFSGGWSFEASALFGVTERARDADLRLFITKSL